MLSSIGRALNLLPRSRRHGLKEDIEKLDRKLRRIRATIEELEHREIHDEAVNLWLQELKCLAGDAEDVLDEYQYETLRCQLEVKPAGTTIPSGQVTCTESNSSMVNHVSSYFSESISLEMTERIRQISSRFDEISRDREALRLTNEEGKRRVGVSSINFSSTSHLMSKDDIFGRSDDKKKIINLLLLEDDEGEDQLKVIPILGMGGIGKTTLAQMVYDELSSSSQPIFDVMAWVYVSPEFDIIRITKEICEFITVNHDNSYRGFSNIQMVLKKELAGKRIFLVLDDVWNVQQNDWELLFLPLKDAELVRVLVTSRLDGVAEAPYAVFPHRLDVLPEHECLKLLYHCANGGKGVREKEWSPNICSQIVKRCGGLPLAVKCIGRALLCSKDKNSWREIFEGELWESDKLVPVFCALKVSYYHLPPKLRYCFLFCSLFPKGSRLRKISIIYMWMAHGFLQPKGKKRAEDVGEEYLVELQMRSFIVPCTKNSFRLHDVIYDLARSLSVEEIHTITDHKTRHLPEKIQHLYIKRGYNGIWSFRPDIRLRTFFNATLVRTCHYFVDLHDVRSVHVLGLIGSNVLALAHSPLKYLRFLGIMEFNGETLPQPLCLLYHLQTLEITHCYHLRELPTNISNLVNLRYLHITHVAIEEIPVMLWRAHNLQTLRIKECCNLRALPLGISNLLNLHVLQLKSCKRLEELPADIGNLINLSLLDLSFSGIRTFPASIGLLKSTKIVLVGVPFVTIPGHIRKQLNSNLVLRRDNIFKRLSCDDKQTLIVELPEHPNKWSQKLALFGSERWQKIRNDNSAAINEMDVVLPTLPSKKDNSAAIVEDIDEMDAVLATLPSEKDNSAAVVEDIDVVSQITWMSSLNQSSIAGIMSYQSRDDTRSRAVSYSATEMNPKPEGLNKGSCPARVEGRGTGSGQKLYSALCPTERWARLIVRLREHGLMTEDVLLSDDEVGDGADSDNREYDRSVQSLQEQAEYPNKQGQKLDPLGSQLSQKIRSEKTATIVEDTNSGIAEDIHSAASEDIGSGSQISWMSSQNQSSIVGNMTWMSSHNDKSIAGSMTLSGPDPKTMPDLDEELESITENESPAMQFKSLSLFFSWMGVYGELSRISDALLSDLKADPQPQVMMDEDRVDDA